MALYLSEKVMCGLAVLNVRGLTGICLVVSRCTEQFSTLNWRLDQNMRISSSR